MKPKRTQRQTGAQWQGKAVNTGEKTMLNPAKQKSQFSSTARVKPFAGKVFYLDLPSNRTAETLERDIKELGGTVEKFFSKEIRYLVSNKREARYVHCFRHDSPVPSPESGPSSPHPRSVQLCPGSHGENAKTKNQGQTDTFATSRGKSLVERVVKEQERLQINKILSNALEWGVKILYIDDVVAYVHKKKKTIDCQVSVTAPVKTHVRAEPAPKQGLHKCKAGKISKPFIKVEDSSRHYRPIYVTVQSMPEFSLKTVAPFSPFCLEDKDPPGNKQRGHGSVKASAVEVKGQVRKKNKDKKRAGYCEGCSIKFDNLTMHLQSQRHKAFSKSKEFSVVDRLISTLSYNFIPLNAKPRRPKCSVSSVIVAPGPCKQAEAGAGETPQGAAGCALPCLENGLKTTSPSDSPPTGQRHEGRGNRYTYSHKSKQKYLAHKRPCRQNSVTSCSQEAEGKVSGCSLETAPPSGDVFSTQKPHKHENGSTSRVPDVSWREVCRAQEPQANEAAMLVDSIHNKKLLFPHKGAEVKVSVKEEEDAPAEGSPVQKLKRKIRVYKQKRRKVETHAEDVASILKLWECFQSSEDMDLDFRGFEDEELT